MDFDDIQTGDGWKQARTIANRWKLERSPLARLVRRTQHNRHAQRIDYSFLDPRERASLKDSRIKAILFHACNALYPEREGHLALDELSLFNNLDNDESSALVATHFALQLIRGRTKSSTAYLLENQLLSYGDMGLYLGAHMVNLGVKNGLLLGIIRPLAFAAMSEVKHKQFDQYLEQLKASQQLFNLKSELKTFECKYPQVAALCLVKLGFSKELALSHYLALDFDIQTISIEAAKLRACFELINASVSDYTPRVSGDYIGALLGKNYQELLHRAIRDSGHNNILRMSQQEPAETTQLVISVSKMEPEADQELDVPSWILKEISMEDLISFRTMILELLNEHEHTH